MLSLAKSTQAVGAGLPIIVQRLADVENNAAFTIDLVQCCTSVKPGRHRRRAHSLY